MYLIRNIFLSIIFTSMCVLAFGQVNSVKYFLRYNESLCLWEVCLLVKDGNATKALDRAQFNSQISVVIPTGTTFSIQELLMPLKGNQNYGGTQPMTWFINNSVSAPASQPQSDFIGIAPVLNPTSFYNNLKAGDTVVLFRAKIDGLKNCGEGVRLFDNAKDPNSGAAGMNGGDFSNGFTMGSIAQKYDGNLDTRKPSAPIISSIKTDCSNGLSINLTSQSLNCHGSTAYLWNGPNNFISTTKNVSIPLANASNSGEYTLYLSDDFGCKDTVKVLATAAPDAGPDSYVKCYQNGLTTLSSNSEGLWRIIASESDGTAQIVTPEELTTEVASFSTSGWYTFERVGESCNDKVKIFVDDNCDCSFGKSVSLTGPTEYCGIVTDVMISGESIPSNNYKWIYKKNSGSFALAPGFNDRKDFRILEIGVGTHSYRRINYSADFSCADTSQAIVINIKPTISVGNNSVVQCYQEDKTTVTSVGSGYWIVGENSAGTVKIKDYYSNTTEIEGFSTSGKYYLIFTNDICSDTVVIDARPFCGCTEAKVASIVNLCQSKNLVLEGSCPNGSWNLIGSPQGVAIDSISKGNAYLKIDWSLCPQIFKAAYTIDLNGLIQSDTSNIYKRNNPTINLGYDFDYCRGSGNAIITSKGGKRDYLWSTGDTTRFILVSPEITSTFWLEAANDYGCKDRDSIKISVHEKPKGQIPASHTFTEGAKMQLNAGFWTDAVHYSWSGPNNFISNSKNIVIPSATLEHAGVYTLAVVSEFDCYTYITTKVEIKPKNFASNKDSKILEIEENKYVESRNEEPEISELLIIPNPADNFVSIVHGKQISLITLTSIEGRTVLTVKPFIEDTSTFIDISTLKSGIYIVSSTNNFNTLSKRLVIGN